MPTLSHDPIKHNATPTASPILTEQEVITKVAGNDKTRVAARKAEAYQY